jgi:hypothetical protein
VVEEVGRDVEGFGCELEELGREVGGTAFSARALPPAAEIGGCAWGGVEIP